MYLYCDFLDIDQRAYVKKVFSPQGLRQGDPLYLSLFILYAESLSLLIYVESLNENLLGCKVNGVRIFSIYFLQMIVFCYVLYLIGLVIESERFCKFMKMHLDNVLILINQLCYLPRMCNRFPRLK